jgi:hypothetical protein
MSEKSVPGIERRKYIRLNEENLLVCELVSPGEFEHETAGEKLYVFTKNLGEGGVLFESDIFFEIGAMLKFEIDIPEWGDGKFEDRKSGASSIKKPFVAIGKVVRAEEIGRHRFDVGVVFAAVDSGQKLALQKYLEMARNRSSDGNKS